MNQEINLVISFAAGLLSFLSPCVLPLVPVYISLIGGLTLADIRNSQYRKSSLVARALVFVAGFTIVFVLMGVFIWGAFRLASGLTTALNVIAGVVIILLGLNVIFDFLSFLNREKRFITGKPISLIGVFLAGLALGAGWSPCIGPLLGSIIALTATEASAAGILNLAAYSLGLGVPFILLALAFIPVSAVLDRIKRHLNTLRISGGVLLVVIGILILLGQFVSLNIFFMKAAFALEEAYAGQPLLFRIGFVILYLVLGALPLGRWLCKRPRAQAGGKGAIPIAQLVWAGILLVPAVLEAADILRTALLLAAWLGTGELSTIK
jgi:cytochrome c-type biogenesis protein